MEKKTTGGNGGQGKNSNTPQLSCELCRERKVKCDKLDPCSNCASAGIPCVAIYRNRLPRGRHVHGSRWPASPPPTKAPAISKEPALDTNAASSIEDGLNQRLRRLESLIESIGPATIMPDAVTGLDFEQPFDSSQMSSFSMTLADPAAPGFSSNSNALVTTQNSQPFSIEDFEGITSHAASFPQPERRDSGMAALSLGMNSNLPLTLPPTIPQPSKRTAYQLCKVYLESVDPIAKVLHRKSLSKWLMDGEGYLWYPNNHTSVDALRSAVCYAAAGSLLESQCQEMLNVSKSDLTERCRKACEVAIERADLLSTRDVTVLQAFTLYLVGRRSESRSVAVWTLIAVAVRIAKAVGLHKDPQPRAGQSESFFKRQMRMRLWLTICALDLDAATEQDTEPLVSHQQIAHSVASLRHINDSDFDWWTTAPEITDREELTDITLAMASFHAQLAERQLRFGIGEDEVGCAPIEDSGRGNLSTTSNVWPSASNREARRRLCALFERKALALLHFCDPESSSYAWYTWHGTQTLVAATRLSVLQQEQKCIATGTTLPVQGSGDTKLLRLALEVLEKGSNLQTNPRAEKFRWNVVISRLTIATAISECAATTDLALVRSAWPLVEIAYKQFGGNAHYSGVLSPLSLDRLMTTAREKLAVTHNAFDIDNMNTRRAASNNALPIPTPLLTPLKTANENLTDVAFATGCPPPTISEMAFEPSTAFIHPLMQQQAWDPALFVPESATASTGTSSSTGNLFSFSPNNLDSTWEDKEGPFSYQIFDGTF